MKNIINKIKYLTEISKLHYNEVELEFNKYVEKYNFYGLYKIKNSKTTHLFNNMHSIFFYSIYESLGFTECERKFCGILNNCLRLIITGADNLLDGDDNHYLSYTKITKSKIMKSVFDLLLAEKIICSVLYNYSHTHNLFRHEKITEIQSEIFKQLTGSGINEAEETQLTQLNFSPEKIISSVHHYKSGKLFTLPFIAAKNINKNPNLLKTESAIYDFGIAVQLLDDISDIYEDFTEKKPNYILALMVRDNILKKSETVLSDLKSNSKNLYSNPVIMRYIDESMITISEKIHSAFSELYSINNKYDQTFLNCIMKLIFTKLKIGMLYSKFIKKLAVD
ncbi:polyprenyl synthetase family protein [Candidatus Dependentiae bacterium]|nr:polyprenyl synthetase family protein [Candidatus Dependentiae bacterium]